jgi:membrane protein
MFAYGFTRPPGGWGQLLKRTAGEFMADNGLGLAAQLAYYFFFALFPTILVGIALASFLPLEDLMTRSVAALQGVLPEDVLRIVQEQIRKISEGQNGGVLTFGLLVAVWSSSAAMVGLIDALNRAYDIEEERPWWKVRLLAIVLTLALAVFVLLAFALVLAGPTAADWLAASVGLGPVFAWTWKILQWPLVIALIVIAVGLVYYFAPDAEQTWVWITPGATLAAVLWLVASLGFKLYVANFSSYTETYGTIGGVMVLLLWFYLTGLTFVAGAELNAEVEHASPYGKAAGEKVPGAKRAIGALAFQRYREGRPSPPAPPTPARPATEPAAGAEGWVRRAAVAGLAALLIFRSHGR